jgi:hypothetical protein
MNHKWIAYYAAAGVATLLWQISRASAATPKPIWAGFGADPANGKPGPGAVQAAAETIAFWPVAAFHNLSGS